MTNIEKRMMRNPDTDYFHFHNQNPKNKFTEDCVFRAISLATGIDYNDVILGMAKNSCKNGYCLNGTKGIETYLKSIGWIKHKQPRKSDNTKFTGKEFCAIIQSSFNPNRKYIANIGGHHIVAIIDGKINDTWNSSGGCIGNFWTKE